MDIPLRVLIIEDSDRDVALEVRALKAAGYQVTYAVAENAAEMKAALAEQAFDIVISDHGMPQFDAPGALAVLKQSGLDIPFIIVSGSIGEEIAVALMRAGAHDYVMKDKLARLVPAVQRELREAESRREHKRADEELLESKSLIEAVVENIPLMIFLKEATDLKFVLFNRAGEELLGYDRKDLLGKNSLDISPPEQAARFMAKDREVLNGESVLMDIPEELIQTAKKGQRLLHTRKVCIKGANGATKYLLGISEDITERNKAEGILKETLESLRKAVNTTIQVMVSAVETRDPYTSGHQTRSANLARAIATELGLPPEKIEGIWMAGSIHDVGKLSIPAEILAKPTKLSPIELLLIKEHANRGYEILKGVESSWPLAEIVRQHHERMDGSGYPRNLKGEEILIEARILNVADVVEAMASHRPYRAGLGINAALDEIEKNRGTIYDEAVVDACLRLFREKGFKLEVA